VNVPMADIKLQDKALRDSIQKEISEVIDSAHFILGENVRQFEYEMAKYIGVAHSVGVASGTDALLLSLMALNIGKHDEVIVTPYTMLASISCVSRVGATPVFVDVNPRTFNIDPNKIGNKITDKTRAIIPVHLFGQSAEMDSIIEIAKRHSLRIIEDACQAIGAEYKARKVGSIGDIGCFSFFPTKNLGGYGDGGMVTTNSEKIAEKIRLLRTHGAKPKYTHSTIGLNSRLDEVQAAILRVKLTKIDEWNDMRRNNAKLYNELLSGTVTAPFEGEFNKHVYHQYTILANHRDELQAYLKTKGVSSEIYYPLPAHLQECYAGLGYKRGDLSVSEELSSRVLSLPVFPGLTTTQIEYVCQMINEF